MTESKFPAPISGEVPRQEMRLDAKDGLNNYHVYLARMALEPQGDTQFSFTVTHSMLPVAEFGVAVKGGGRSLDDMTHEAHEALIDVFRQLLFRAEKGRQSVLRNAAKTEPAAVHSQENDEETPH